MGWDIEYCEEVGVVKNKHAVANRVDQYAITERVLVSVVVREVGELNGVKRLNFWVGQVLIGEEKCGEYDAH